MEIFYTFVISSEKRESLHQNPEIMKERLKRFMDYKKITAADLADRIGVQRSNVSHILNGRNKPASQFIEKLLLSFPDLDANWLLTGLGKMIRGEEATPATPLPREIPAGPPRKEVPTLQEKAEVKPAQQVKEIERIVVFYRDHTFTDYKPD